MTTFMLMSLVLCLAGVPMFATAEFLMTRHLADPLIAASAWLYLAVAYWWPLGAWLFYERFRLWVRLVLGYVLSLPLYFAGLWVSYAAIGYHFAPANTGWWITYLSVSPWFYLYVVLLWLLVRRPRAALVVRRIAAAVAVTAVAAPIVARAGIDRVRPPHSTPVTRISNARVVDPVDGLLPGLRDVVIADGRIYGPMGSGCAASPSGCGSCTRIGRRCR